MKYLTKNEAIQKDSLSLALVGDAVWSLFVRQEIVLQHDYKAYKASQLAVKFVNAAAQCKMLYAIEGELSETEQDVVRRARNVKVYTKAKNASLDEYKKATALEALMGYLHLTGQSERLSEIMEKCFSAIRN